MKFFTGLFTIGRNKKPPVPRMIVLYPDGGENQFYIREVLGEKMMMPWMSTALDINTWERILKEALRLDPDESIPCASKKFNEGRFEQRFITETSLDSFLYYEIDVQKILIGSDFGRIIMAANSLVVEDLEMADVVKSLRDTLSATHDMGSSVILWDDYSVLMKRHNHEN
jgi:hypothetical protein